MERINVMQSFQKECNGQINLNMKEKIQNNTLYCSVGGTSVRATETLENSASENTSNEITLD